MTDARRLPRQGGFLLIVGAILIVLGALLAVVATFMAITRSESAVDHLGSGQALFLAESGRVQALRALVVDNRFCSQITYSNVSLGAGTFTAVGTSYKAGTVLASGIGTTDTVIPAGSVAGFASHGEARIDLERINYSGIGTTAPACAPAAAPCLTGVRRGVAGTAALAHAANISVGQEQCMIVSTGTASSTTSTRTVESAHQIMPAMMVYAKAAGDSVPYFRLWDGTAWGLERQASPLAAGISFLGLKMARTRNEAILVTQTTAGIIDAQIWNGVAWTTLRNMATIAVAAQRAMKGFDLAYETASDRALIVYNKGVDDTFSFQIWTGTGWISNADQGFPNATMNFPQWLRLAANPLPTSNEIAMMTLTSATDIYGMLWSGATWSTMSVTTAWDTAAATATRQAFDVAYESLSGQPLFAWGNSVAETARWRKWNGSSLSTAAAISNANLNATIGWCQLAPDPYSNRILFGAQSNLALPVTVVWPWNGTSFAVATAIETTGEIASSRNFDLVFETAPNASNRARVVYGNGGAVSVRRGYVIGGIYTWDAAAGLTGGDNTAYVRTVAHPRTGTVLAALYENRATAGGAGDLLEIHLTDGGNTWTSAAASVIWSGPTVLNTQGFGVDIAVSKYLPRIDWMEIFQ